MSTHINDKHVYIYIYELLCRINLRISNSCPSCLIQGQSCKESSWGIARQDDCDPKPTASSGGGGFQGRGLWSYSRKNIYVVIVYHICNHKWFLGIYSFIICFADFMIYLLALTSPWRILKRIWSASKRSNKPCRRWWESCNHHRMVWQRSSLIKQWTHPKAKQTQIFLSW